MLSFSNKNDQAPPLSFSIAFTRFVALSATKIGIIIKREEEKREKFEVKDEKRLELRKYGFTELREVDNLMSSQRKYKIYLAESQKMRSFAV